MISFIAALQRLLWVAGCSLWAISTCLHCSLAAPSWKQQSEWDRIRHSQDGSSEKYGWCHRHGLYSRSRKPGIEWKERGETVINTQRRQHTDSKHNITTNVILWNLAQLITHREREKAASRQFIGNEVSGARHIAPSIETHTLIHTEACLLSSFSPSLIVFITQTNTCKHFCVTSVYLHVPIDVNFSRQSEDKKHPKLACCICCCFIHTVAQGSDRVNRVDGVKSDAHLRF